MKKINTFLILIVASMATMNTTVAQSTNNIEYEYYKIVVNAPEIKIPEEVTINGIVKDEAGTPLTNAKVRADFGQEILTDNNGAFSFTLKKEQVASQSLFVSYADLVTAVRSYHPSMVNTTYDITLYKPTACCNVKKCDNVTFETFTISFKPNKNSLSEATKKQLDAIAGSLKECPSGKIRLTAHSDKSKSLQRSANSQLNAVKNYLIEQNGISADRIRTNEIIEQDGNNSIDVTPE